MTYFWEIKRTAKINITQVYAPTEGTPDKEIEQFYGEINQVLKSIEVRDVALILGDFNSKIGKGKSRKYLGEYGLGPRNYRGDRM